MEIHKWYYVRFQFAFMHINQFCHVHKHQEIHLNHHNYHIYENEILTKITKFTKTPYLQKSPDLPDITEL